MNAGKTLFAQLMDFLPWSTFARIVARYGGDRRVRPLSCAEQYRAIAKSKANSPSAACARMPPSASHAARQGAARCSRKAGNRSTRAMASAGAVEPARQKRNACCQRSGFGRSG